MITKIVSRQIKGKSRGREMGFPTINLEINSHFVLPIGVYGVWVVIDKNRFLGALHYGPTPTFHSDDKTLEVHLINVKQSDLPDKLPCPVIIEVIGRIRDVKKFDSGDELAKQIKKDINVIRALSSR